MAVGVEKRGGGMSAIQWVSKCGRVTLYLGDCLEILPTLPTCDAAITDPPYMLGAISSGSKTSKGGTFNDLMNFSYWYAGWMNILADKGATLAVFGNWRSIPVYESAFSKAGCKTYSCIVWDKEWIGPGQYFRPSYEIIMIGGRKPPQIIDRSARDVIRHKWMACHSGGLHPAQKPIEVIEHLASNISAEDSLVLDPFMGSGTTGVACIRTGRRFIGIEIDEGYFATAKQRIQDELDKQAQMLDFSNKEGAG